jgi:hypothetical protein
MLFIRFGCFDVFLTWLASLFSNSLLNDLQASISVLAPSLFPPG